MLQKPGATSYIGCIGKDKFAEEMKRDAKDAGVNVGYSCILLLLCFYEVHTFGQK